MRNKTRKKHGNTGKQIAAAQRSKRPLSNFLAQHREMRLEARSGPLPDANELERYQSIHPDLVPKILDAFEKNGEHRRQIEMGLLLQERKNAWRTHMQIVTGQIFALITVMGILCLAYLLLEAGHPGYAATLAGAGLAGIIAAWLGGRQRQEQKEK